MKQGVLLFAHNNEKLDYGLLATWQANRISYYLNKPVSLVTDQHTIDTLIKQNVYIDEYFDSIIISDANTDQNRVLNNNRMLFKNVDRVAAYKLSPYDETLIIDTDIVIASDRLNLVWNNIDDLLISKYAADVFDRKYNEFEYLKEHGIEFFWATEMFFRKSNAAELFFERCTYIKENYEWFSKLYGVSSSPIRNDHVWSIAIHELGGLSNSSWVNRIPRELLFSLDRDELLRLDGNSLTILGNDNGRDKCVGIEGRDVHVMNKFDLIKFAKKELGVKDV